MAESFAVSAENLTDTHVVDDLAPVDAALIEPLACVAKSLARLRHAYDPDRIRVIGLGSMGLLHMLALPGAWGCDVSPARLRWAERQGLKVARPEELTPGAAVFVCPGSQSAFETGLKLLEPGGELVMFSPLGPDEQLTVPQGAYFADATIHSSYSCGPDDSRLAIRWLREGRVRAQQVVSDFIALDELPRAYLAMRAGEILKAMVVF
jgi:L-iditol 2-dehydrogenase